METILHAVGKTPFALFTLVLLLLTPASFAGEIVFMNGDRLSGTIIERRGGVIVFEHVALGRMEVPLESVQRVITVKPLFPTTPRAGELPHVPEVIPPEDLEEPEEEPADLPTTPPTPAPGPAPEPAVTPEPEKKPAEWNSQIELGINASEGTTQDLRVRSGFRTTRKTEANLFRYDITYRLATSRGDRTENYLTTGVFSEWPVPTSPWSMFVQNRYDYSEFQSWDHRLTGGLGLGHRLIRLKDIDKDGNEYERLNVKLRGGGGYRKEFGSLERREFEPEGILGFEFGWAINTRMRLEAGSTYYPSLKELDDYRVVSSIDWTVDINRFEGVKLKLGAAHEYESQVDPGVARDDLSVYASLVIDF